MHEHPPASMHVKRHLSMRELATIAVALELLSKEPASGSVDEIRCVVGNGEPLLDDHAMRALGYELYCSRKVKVCRSKRKPA